ncbi:hypothetical protein OJAV_G00223160 [Oryzias javanicus]|uniref:Secreted protein n=1 Tax=Oryzias javanicus TaxID=123683 RepID=A0A3S2MDD8_ORYJA|nr:hypothetical protein OJAV_G00223160 [Oryzias javanicus]
MRMRERMRFRLALGSAVCGLKYCFGCGSCDGGLTQVPQLTIQPLQIGFKTALWMHLDVCNDCCGWHASVFWTPFLWTQ